MVRAPLPLELLEELIVPYLTFLHMHMLFEYAMKRNYAFSSLMLVLFGLLYFCYGVHKEANKGWSNHCHATNKGPAGIEPNLLLRYMSCASSSFANRIKYKYYIR